MLPKNYRWIDAFTLSCSTGCAGYISERRDRRGWIAHVYNSRGRVLRGRHGTLRAAQRAIERWIAAQVPHWERARAVAPIAARTAIAPSGLPRRSGRRADTDVSGAHRDAATRTRTR